MRTWTSPGLMYLVVGVLGCAGACEWAVDEREPDWSAVRSSLANNPAGSSPYAAGPGDCSKYLFLPNPIGSVTCPLDMCGVNGVWLGRGVPFRTLNLDGSENKKHLSIKSFVSGSQEPLVVDVVRDSLIGKKKDPTGDLTGTELINSILTLEQNDAFDPTGRNITIDFKILDVKYLDFEATCVPPYKCDYRPVPFYRFIATTSNGCNVQICKPGLNSPDDARSNLAGDAFIFEGDLYNEDTFEVSITPKQDNPKGTFNLACEGTTISKLHLLRHTSASQSPYVPPASQPNEYQREALLRLFTADYCGRAAEPLVDPNNPNNSPPETSLFTHNGVPIRISFNGGVYQPAPKSRFLVGPDDISEGRWNADGAACIGTPRLQHDEPDVLNVIKDTCAATPHPFPSCGDVKAPNGYASSYNPPVDAGISP